MRITVDISLYPLDANYKPAIRRFIKMLRTYPGLNLHTNQMGTQVNGEFAAVTAAVNACMEAAMEEGGKVVVAARYVNSDLAIDTVPDLE
ncbi:MAG: thiamine-binding protein [Gammaproteobacteria bacterium]|jgi:uncharacterized protein YqgV (UPF0045/DUF77 family)|nr:thiamine-binding protein [Gammaproteobacteria bacterium]